MLMRQTRCFCRLLQRTSHAFWHARVKLSCRASGYCKTAAGIRGCWHRPGRNSNHRAPPCLVVMSAAISHRVRLVQLQSVCAEWHAHVHATCTASPPRLTWLRSPEIVFFQLAEVAEKLIGLSASPGVLLFHDSGEL